MSSNSKPYLGFIPNAPLSDLEAVINLWISLASLALFVRQYQSLLTRLCYIALLMYWYVYLEHNYSLFSEILVELMRWKNSPKGETNILGKHYTITIAEIVFVETVFRVLMVLLPDNYWALVILVGLQVLILQSNVAQLWLQKQVTRIARWNRKMWKLRGLVIENVFLFVMRRADSGAMRGVAQVWYWMWYQFTVKTHPAMLKGLPSNFLVIYFMTGFKPPRPVFLIFNALITYYLLFRELGKFANPNPPKHKYTPLKNQEDIRVILLYPRLAFGPICCSLLQGPHMRLIFYEAISYTWGSGDLTDTILLDGCTKDVTKSVYELLLSYSSLLIPKLLWIDALCIDQENNEEKTKQVQLMEKIYRNAELTTVFLGRSPLPEERDQQIWLPWQFRYDGVRSDDEKTRQYFEDARLTFDLLNELRILDSALRSSEYNIYEVYDAFRNSSSKSRQWDALLTMLRHPWFERVWVVQEVALADKVEVRYGDEVISWEVLASGMEKLHRQPHFRLWLECFYGVQLRHVQHTSLYNITRMHRFRETFQDKILYSLNRFIDGSGDPLLSELLAESFYFKATNPRDLIYGLMAICRDPVEVDYGASVHDVYLNAAKALYERGAIPLLLHAAGIRDCLEPTSIASKLPSWVPDWTNAPKYGRLRDLGKWGKLKEFNAGGKVEPKVKIKRGRVLALRGLCIDVIDELGPVLFDTTIPAGRWTSDEMFQLATKYEKFWKQLVNNPYTTDPYPHSTQDQSLREAFRRTICTDKDWFRWIESPDEFYNLFPDWEEKIKSFLVEFGEPFPGGREAMYELLKSMDRVTEQVKSSCGGRQLFITKKGYVGLCPPYALREDVISIIPGIHVPLVLRPVNTANVKGSRKAKCATKRYKFVGECYMHGVMNGEALSFAVGETEMEVI